jgi:hypothetical protein
MYYVNLALPSVPVVRKFETLLDVLDYFMSTDLGDCHCFITIRKSDHYEYPFSHKEPPLKIEIEFHHDLIEEHFSKLMSEVGKLLVSHKYLYGLEGLLEIKHLIKEKSYSLTRQSRLSEDLIKVTFKGKEYSVHPRKLADYYGIKVKYFGMMLEQIEELLPPETQYIIAMNNRFQELKKRLGTIPEVHDKINIIKTAMNEYREVSIAPMINHTDYFPFDRKCELLMDILSYNEKTSQQDMSSSDPKEKLKAGGEKKEEKSQTPMPAPEEVINAGRKKKEVRYQTLKEAFEKPDDYQMIRQLLIDKGYCDPVSMAWNKEKKPYYVLAALLKFLHQKKYFKKNSKLTYIEMQTIARNTFIAEIELSTIGKATIKENLNHFQFIPAASDVPKMQ